MTVAHLCSRSAVRRSALAVSGLLLLACLWQQRREDAQFEKLVGATFHLPSESHTVPTSQANAVLLLHQVHDAVQESTVKMGADTRMDGQYFWSPSDHLRHPGGACASYSTVLAKALQTAGYQVRKVGLAHDGKKAIHHVIEAFADGHWMLMDAAFDLAFAEPDGSKASAAEVASHWAFFKKQTPANYPAAFDYKDFYYTNWDRIPGASLAFKLWPDLKAWVDVHEVSLRLVFLNIWNWMAAVWAGVFCFFLIVFPRPRASPKLESPSLSRQLLLRTWLF
jgi:hypothetical protein